jgi:hypothetical protein
VTAGTAVPRSPQRRSPANSRIGRTIWTIRTIFSHNLSENEDFTYLSDDPNKQRRPPADRNNSFREKLEAGLKCPAQSRSDRVARGK